MTQMTDKSATNPWAAAIRAAFANKAFVVAVVIMAMAAFGLGAATQFLQLQFRKVAVPLVKPFETVPQKLGDWVQVSSDQRLEEDIEQTLGTHVYVFRDYVDSRLVGSAKVEEIIAKSGMERRRAIAEIEARMPKSVVHFAVTYYTGMVDTVAHVPDRCYIADGYVPTEYEVKTWKLAPNNNSVEVRFINFEDATGFTSRVSKSVAYFFQVNGALVSSPIAVRGKLQNLMRADVYYAKIELMTLIHNREESARVLSDFLSQALPEVQKCLPPIESKK